MSDSSVGDAFRLTLPLWFLVNPHDKVNGILEMKSVNGDIGTPMFLSRTEVDAFANAGDWINAKFEVGMVEDPPTLLVVLSRFEKRGMTHVAFVEGTRRTRFQSISELRDIIAASRKTIDPELN